MTLHDGHRACDVTAPHRAHSTELDLCVQSIYRHTHEHTHEHTDAQTTAHKHTGMCVHLLHIFSMHWRSFEDERLKQEPRIQTQKKYAGKSTHPAANMSMTAPVGI